MHRPGGGSKETRTCKNAHAYYTSSSKVVFVLNYRCLHSSALHVVSYFAFLDSSFVSTVLNAAEKPLRILSLHVYDSIGMHRSCCYDY